MTSSDGGGANPAYLLMGGTPMPNLPIAGSPEASIDPKTYGEFQSFLPDAPDAGGGPAASATGLTKDMFDYRKPGAMRDALAQVVAGGGAGAGAAGGGAGAGGGDAGVAGDGGSQSGPVGQSGGTVGGGPYGAAMEAATIARYGPRAGWPSWLGGGPAGDFPAPTNGPGFATDWRSKGG